MLKKSSVFMMLLIITASLIGISSIHQNVEGQKPPAAPPVSVGDVAQVTTYAPVAGCIASVVLSAGSVI